MNYDQWKLSNPIDDGDGYNMVSNCCGAMVYDDTDICSECGEHEKVYWHWIDFDYKIVNVECVVCTNSAERKVN